MVMRKLPKNLGDRFCAKQMSRKISRDALSFCALSLFYQNVLFCCFFFAWMPTLSRSVMSSVNTQTSVEACNHWRLSIDWSVTDAARKGGFAPLPELWPLPHSPLAWVHTWRHKGPNSGGGGGASCLLALNDCHRALCTAAPLICHADAFTFCPFAPADSRNDSQLMLTLQSL